MVLWEYLACLELCFIQDYCRIRFKSPDSMRPVSATHCFSLRISLLATKGLPVLWENPFKWVWPYGAGMGKRENLPCIKTVNWLTAFLLFNQLFWRRGSDSLSLVECYCHQSEGSQFQWLQCASFSSWLLRSKMIIVWEQQCSTVNFVGYLQNTPCPVKMLTEITVELQYGKG